MKKIALIWCSDVSGDEPLRDSIKQTFHSEGEQWEILSPNEETFLTQALHYDGYVISGSPKSVVEDAESLLVKNLLALIRWVQRHSLAPMIGLCFGSQAIAVALGGVVENISGAGFRLGVDSLTWNEAVDSSRWPEICSPAVLVKSHGQCVSLLPSDSINLASSKTTRNEVFLIADRFLGIQGHPETNNELMQQGFMPYHRSMFDDEQWLDIERESKQTLHIEPLVSLGRRLLLEGSL